MTLYLTIEEAAEQLRMTPDALRRRCARAARKVGRDITAQLGDGIVGVKFGKSWRVRFRDAWPGATLPGACSAPVCAECGRRIRIAWAEEESWET